MDTAERLIRTRGYSAFSYADLAEAVGIRKASIHYHFPTKGDLGEALVSAYITRFRDMLAEIDTQETTARARLARYGEVYEDSVAQGMTCLCGMLSTEVTVLPEGVQNGVQRFFKTQLDWLRTTLASGRDSGEFRLPGDVDSAADHFFSAMQGASFVARAMEKPAIVTDIKKDMLTAWAQ